MCSELTPRAPIPDTRIPQLMQPWWWWCSWSPCWARHSSWSDRFRRPTRCLLLKVGKIGLFAFWSRCHDKDAVCSDIFHVFQNPGLTINKRDSSAIQIPYDCIKKFKEFDHCLVVKFMNIIGELIFLLTWMKKAHLCRQQQGQSLEVWDFTTTHPSSHLKAKSTALSGAESFSCKLQSLWNPKESFKHSSLRARHPSQYF